MTSNSAGITGPTGPEYSSDGWYIAMGESADKKTMFKGEEVPAWKVSWQRVRNRQQVEALQKELYICHRWSETQSQAAPDFDIVWCLKIGSPSGMDELAEELYYAEGELSSRQNKHFRLLRNPLGYPTIPPSMAIALGHEPRVKAYQDKLLNAQRAIIRRGVM